MIPSRPFNAMRLKTGDDNCALHTVLNIADLLDTKVRNIRDSYDIVYTYGVKAGFKSFTKRECQTILEGADQDLTSLKVLSDNLLHNLAILGYQKDAAHDALDDPEGGDAA